MAYVFGTLAQEVDGIVEYIYPKTLATMVEYDTTMNVKEKIDSLAEYFESNLNEKFGTITDYLEKNKHDNTKVNKPIQNNEPYDGKAGQMLESNGDGTTSWMDCAKIYVGEEDDMPEGYDVQINPNGIVLTIDRTLSVDGACAEASAVGFRFNTLEMELANIKKAIGLS